jgi:hypothetical protein
MANMKISALPVATTPVSGTAQVPVVQAGVTKVATVADIRNTPEPFVMTAQATGSVTASAADTVKMFARSYAGRVIPEFMGQAGIDCFVQPAMFNNGIVLWSPAATTVGGTLIGSVSTTAATIGHPTLAATNMQTQMRRTSFTTSTTAGNASGIRGSTTHVWRGNAANVGGFFAFFRFSQSLNITASQCFVGLSASTAALAGEPNALPNIMGMGYNSTDATGTGWKLMMNDASGTATSVTLTGAPRDTTTVLDLTLYCPANSSGITARIYNQSTQSVVLDNVTYTTDIPANTAFLTYHAQCRTTTTTATNLELARIYIETDI